jgi:hypothetical protein
MSLWATAIQTWEAEADPTDGEYLAGMTGFARREIPEAAGVSDRELHRLITIASYSPPPTPDEWAAGVDIDAMLDQVIVDVRAQLLRSVA